MNQIYIFVQIFCAILAAAILVHLVYNGRRFRGTHSYMVCILLFFLWNLAEVLLLMSQTPTQEMRALKLKFIPVVYIGVSWLYFCLSITHAKLVESKMFKSLLIIFPAICYFFLLTNEWHQLFYIEVVFKTKLHRGPIFWIHTVESYLCIFIGTIYFFVYMKNKIRRSVKEILWLLIAVLLPMAANFLMLCEIIPNKGIDITAQVLLLTMVLFGVMVYQKRFLNLIPVAAKDFVQNMSDGIIIIDHENLVVGINEAVKRLFPGLRLKIYDPANKISQYIADKDKGPFKERLVESLDGQSPPELKKGTLEIEGLSINMEMRILAGFKQAATGKIIILEDRTEEQKLMEEIKNKNMLLTRTNARLTLSNTKLTEANHRLEQFSGTIEELAITRERNRVGREVHDTVGHTLTLLIALAENVKTRLYEDQQDLRGIMDKSIDLSRTALNDIRNCLKGICVESFKETNLMEWMNHLVKVNATSGTRVEFSMPEEIPRLNEARVMAIYRICQESITNAIRHGKAETVSILLKSYDSSVRLYIFNDGAGCRKIVKGYGLTGMEERIHKFGGSITFGSDGEKGFNIIADIPV